VLLEDFSELGAGALAGSDSFVVDAAEESPAVDEEPASGVFEPELSPSDDVEAPASVTAVFAFAPSRLSVL
jgi:hypothetical protein